MEQQRTASPDEAYKIKVSVSQDTKPTALPPHNIYPQVPITYGRQLPPTPVVTKPMQQSISPQAKVDNDWTFVERSQPRRNFTFKTIARTGKTVRMQIEQSGAFQAFATIFDDHISLQDNLSQQFGKIVKEKLSIRSTYILQVANKELATCTKRFKFGSEKKLHYEMKQDTRLLKLGGDFAHQGKMTIMYNDNILGELQCDSENQFSAVADANLDPLHVWAMCVIMIDVKTFSSLL
ncbi:Pkn3 [Acrasis kona]|uniref:Pkn3 n=1 Tax=Acrasis kona TaxID=1008807 RepID=A0AAW2Z4C5_9EUKA